MAAILLVAALASAFLGEFVEASLIGAMVVLGACINAIQSTRSQRAIHSLESRLTPTAKVRRDGTWIMVPRRELVVGDIIALNAGDLVPADARLVTAEHLHVQQAPLTGEALPVPKQVCPDAIAHPEPMERSVVFLGTSVVSGSATAAVFATGRRSAYSDIAARLGARPEETEFERGMARFGSLILHTVSFLTLFTIIAALALGRDPLQGAVFAVALAVGLTPEYLPLITTATLAQGALRMARERVFVKHLASIQNLGSIDILCSDKTGTLTTGEMTLDGSWDCAGGRAPQAARWARLHSEAQTGVVGPLDAAILAGTSVEDLHWEKLGELPFDFERRRVSVVVDTRAGADARMAEAEAPVLVTKGAPESVLECCAFAEQTSRLSVPRPGGAPALLENDVTPLDDKMRHACLASIDAWSRAGLRTLAAAVRPWATGGALDASMESNLTLVGFLTFRDEVLPGLDRVLGRLAEDGVRVKILTGDNPEVTKALCTSVGLNATRVVRGGEIERLDEEALGHVVQNNDVFARVSPAQKERVVMALRRRGHVVGFLGDGINDAPSLHAADVGISVAGATDVAREAADIVLLERRLDVLHGGILMGRRAFANVFKYLTMGTSSNFGNMVSMAGAVLFLPFLPMLPAQVLLNNLLYDVAQLAIPTDSVDPAFTAQPQRWRIDVIRNFMLLVGPVSSLFDALTFAVLRMAFHLDEAGFQTGWFMESLATQVIVVFVIRTPGRPWRHRASVFLAGTALVVVALGFALPQSALGAWFGFTPVRTSVLVYVAVVVPAYLAVVELLKPTLMRKVFTPAPRLLSRHPWTHRGQTGTIGTSPFV